MKSDVFKYGIKNELIPKTSWYNVKRIIGKKISFRVFNLLLLGLAIFVIGMILSPTTAPEQECPECEECEVCEECEESICPEVEPQKELKIISTYVCIDGTIAGDPKDCLIKEEQLQKYVCEDGTVVDKAEDCKKTIEITTQYQETDNEITLAVDDLDYEMKGDDWGTITQISYTIQNLGETPILPEVQVRVYNHNDTTEIKTQTRHTIKINKTLEKDDFVQGVEDVHIGFKGLNITTKFVLVNGLEEFSQAKVVFERPLNGE